MTATRTRTARDIASPFLAGSGSGWKLDGSNQPAYEKSALWGDARNCPCVYRDDPGGCVPGEHKQQRTNYE